MHALRAYAQLTNHSMLNFHGLLMFCFSITFTQCFTLHFLADSYLTK